MNAREWLAVGLTTLLIGCGNAPLAPNQAGVTIMSSPPGARVVTANNSGEAPERLYWTLNGATSTSNPITVTWVSGASVTFRLALVAGTETNYVAHRPVGAPGLELDFQWAMQQAQNKQRSDAEVGAALSDAAGSLGRALGSRKR